MQFSIDNYDRTIKSLFSNVKKDTFIKGDLLEVLATIGLAPEEPMKDKKQLLGDKMWDLVS